MKAIIINPSRDSLFEEVPEYVEFWTIKDSDNEELFLNTLKVLKKTQLIARSEFDKELSELTKTRKKGSVVFNKTKNYTLLKSHDSEIVSSVQEINRLWVLIQNIDYFLQGSNKFTKAELSMIEEPIDLNIHPAEYHKVFLDGLIDFSTIPEEEKFSAIKLFLMISRPSSHISWSSIDWVN